jgi:hypothetical protein
VPDANALIWNPALEDWRFGGVDRFTVALTCAAGDGHG